ncbi:hypothetical protein K439DRAFT_1170444 [Ramaria rubella]|nr:hypothetical protein K439DRAFT_1170444 [Ramaria rubella]
MCEYAIEHRVRGPAKMRRRDVPLVLSPSSGLQAQKTFAHPYAPPALSVPSRWNPSAIPSKDMGLSAGKRMAWPLSDQSDTSSDSSGAASYEQPSDKMYQELNNTRGMNPTSQRHPQSINYPNDRFKGIMHYPPGDTKEQLLLAPILRLPQSLPQFKPLSFQHRGANDSLGSSPSTSYSASSDLSKPFTLLSSSQGSFSRCPSPDSSRTSQNCSCSDGPQRHLASKTLGFEDTTSMLENSMSTHSRNEDGLHKAVSATEAEAEIPRSSSQSFNVSEWITVADCSSSPDHKYSSAESATPES